MVCHLPCIKPGFHGGSVVQNLPAIQEMQFLFLGVEEHLEEGMATHFSILAWKISWRSLAGTSSRSCTESDTTEAT